MQDATMKFGNRMETTTVSIVIASDKRPDYRSEDDHDDAEYRDAIDPGFTMEKLAYLLIGTCCGLSILCLFVVVIAIKCRRAIVEKRLKAHFKKRMYHHERMTDITNPWQQQMFDHFMYLNRRPGGSSCSSNTDSCNCRCVTWSLGARNLDSTRPLYPTSRNSLSLYGQKKLPFGAASTLRFESMLGRKGLSPDRTKHKTESPHTDSSHENDSLDIDSDSREGDGPKQCTCIDYNVWQMPPANVPRGFFTVCPNPRRYYTGNCVQHTPVDFRTIPRDLPPPVTGSNYLDRSEGVVYWSNNEERLI